MKQLETVKIPLHSIIDLITNSSTEIFVHSEGSLESCKELVNEFLKTFNVGGDMFRDTLTCDDVFDLSIEFTKYILEDYIEYYLNYDTQHSDKPAEMKAEFEKYLKGELPKPSWVEDYHLETKLVIKPKEEKYAKLATLFESFLYSGDYFEHSSD
jgi:hypothetical protein